VADLLGELVRTIETLRERMGRYNLELSKNEFRTRVVLIDPMLKALGWDATDPSLVTVEYEVPPGRADYGLRRGLDNPPVVLIEAKKLNEPLDPHVGQLLNYALVRGVRYGCLTDGNIWEVYDVFQQVPLEERKILRVTIADAEPGKVALAMLGLWQRSLEDGSYEYAAEPLIETETHVAPDPVPYIEVAPEPRPMPVQSVAQASAPSGGAWTPLTGDFETTNRPAPAVIRLPSGEERDIRSWRGIVIESVRWLHKEGVLTHEECQFRSGHKRYLYNTDGIHPNGGAFHTPIPVGDTGIIVEGNISSTLSVRSVRRLLEHLGKDPSQVYLNLP